MRFISRTSKAAGSSPGTLIHIGEKRTDAVNITRIEYNQTDFFEKKIDDVKSLEPVEKGGDIVTWVNIDGLHDVALMETVGNLFGIHSLVMEDILNTAQRPKMEDFEDYLFVTLKMFYRDESRRIEAEQISIILGKNYVLSFTENTKDSLNIIKDRLRRGKGKIRQSGGDYLAYALIDMIVDHYFVALDHYNKIIDAMEDEVIESPQQESMQSIHAAKRELIFFHRQIWPLRELLGQLKKGDQPHIRETTRIYIADVYDHLTQVLETTESFRDIISGLQDLYLSTISQKMNEVMKVLTIIATIFIPLTFIAGVYGMNFKYMPELEWRWGYFTIWGVMLVIGCGLVYYFKKKRWL